MMKKTVRTKTRTVGDLRITTTTTTVTTTWVRKKGGWQLPCGCIGPDIMSSDDEQKAECTDCGRGWYHMGARYPGRQDICVMLDGEPQGKPVLVLTEAMLAE